MRRCRRMTLPLSCPSSPTARSILLAHSRPLGLNMIKNLGSICVAAILLNGCDQPPKLSESEQEYCVLLEQHSTELSQIAHASGGISRNGLRAEAWETADRDSLQKFNARLQRFFVQHPVFEAWAAKLGAATIMNNGRPRELENNLLIIDGKPEPAVNLPKVCYGIIIKLAFATYDQPLRLACAGPICIFH